MSFLFPSSTITLEAALRDVTSTNVKARLRAVTALGDLEDATERRRAVAALTVALEDDHPGVRAEASASLGQMGELAPVPALIARLADGDSQVRQQAAIALGTVRDRAGFAPLLEALRDGPADLRYQAVTSLAEIDAVAAYEPLVEALGDRDPQVVSSAAVALGSLGDGRAVQHLLPLLGRAEPDVRFEAAWALSELGDGRGRAELIAQLPGAEAANEASAEEEPGAPAGAEASAPARRPRAEPVSTAHPGRALEAVAALARLGTTADRRALARFLGSRSAPPEAIIVAARHVLALLEAEGAEPAGPAAAAAAAGAAADRATADRAAADRAAARRVLVAALAARKDHLRGLAVEQLVQVGGPWALEALDKLATSRRGRLFAEQIAEARIAIAARQV